MRRKVLLIVILTMMLMGFKGERRFLRMELGQTIFVICDGADLIIGGIERRTKEDGTVVEFRKLHCDERGGGHGVYKTLKD